MYNKRTGEAFASPDLTRAVLALASDGPSAPDVVAGSLARRESRAVESGERGRETECLHVGGALHLGEENAEGRPKGSGSRFGVGRGNLPLDSLPEVRGKRGDHFGGDFHFFSPRGFAFPAPP